MSPKAKKKGKAGPAKKGQKKKKAETSSEEDLAESTVEDTTSSESESESEDDSQQSGSSSGSSEDDEDANEDEDNDEADDDDSGSSEDDGDNDEDSEKSNGDEFEELADLDEVKKTPTSNNEEEDTEAEEGDGEHGEEAGEEGDEEDGAEEEGGQDGDDRNSCDTVDVKDIKNRVMYTARGKPRVRSIRWSREERVALFYNLLKNFDVLKKRGPDKTGIRKDTWKSVQDKVNSCGQDNGRTLQQVKKQISDYYDLCKKKNDALLKKMKKKGKRLKSGLNAVEAMCLQWKGEEKIIGPKGFMMYGRTAGGETVSKKKKSKKSSKKELVKSKSKKKKPKRGSKSKKKDAVQEGEVTFKVEPTKKTTKKTTPKKPPLKRTARMRGPLPDLDDAIDLEAYVYGSKKHGASLKTESDDDDLIATYIGERDTEVSSHSYTDSKIKTDIFVDLTSGHCTSTPIPGNSNQSSSHIVASAGMPLRRSPRSVPSKDSPTKSPASGSGAKSTAKKSLAYDKKDAVPSTSAQSLEKEAGPSQKAVQKEPSPQEEMSMRIATLESLVSSMEMERRTHVKYELETNHKVLTINSRITDLFARIVSDREMIVKSLHITTSNQKELLAALSSIVHQDKDAPAVVPAMQPNVANIPTQRKVLHTENAGVQADLPPQAKVQQTQNAGVQVDVPPQPTVQPTGNAAMKSHPPPQPTVQPTDNAAMKSHPPPQPTVQPTDNAAMKSHPPPQPTVQPTDSPFHTGTEDMSDLVISKVEGAVLTEMGAIDLSMEPKSEEHSNEELGSSEPSQGCQEVKEAPCPINIEPLKTEDPEALDFSDPALHKEENLTHHVGASSLVEEPIPTTEPDKVLGMCTQGRVAEVASTSHVIEASPNEHVEAGDDAQELVEEVVQTLSTLSSVEPPKKKVKLEVPDKEGEEEEAETTKGKGKKARPKSTRKTTRKR